MRKKAKFEGQLIKTYLIDCVIPIESPLVFAIDVVALEMAAAEELVAAIPLKLKRGFVSIC